MATWNYRTRHVYPKNLTDSTGLGYWIAEYSSDGGTVFNNVDPNIPYFQSLKEAQQILNNVIVSESTFITQVAANLSGSASTATAFTGF